MILSLFAVTPALAAPTIGGTTDATYVEGDPATLVATNLTIADGVAYGGQYLEFSVTGATSGETLGLEDDGVADTSDGVVSVVGGSVYLGNGTTADNIGSIDGLLDGTNGSPLRVNFTSAFENASFETGDLTGWTPLLQQIDLGTTTIAGCPTVDTSTYPAEATNEDNNVPSTLGNLTTPVVSSQASDGTYSLQLESTNMTTLVGYDVVHGPAVYSDPFEAAAGDTIYFDWRAYAGDDDYHVFGYIIDESCNQTELLDATGGGNTDWATQPTVIPASGTYRFVFVSGTFDASGGRAAGASLYIDHVQVFGSKATDAVAQAVARKVTYVNTDEESPTSRTLNITAQSASEGSSSASLTINVHTDPATTTDVVATAGAGSAQLTWTAPDPGYSAITDYVIQYSSDGGSTWDTFDDGVSTTTDTTVTGLTNGTEYVFRVAAVNTVGTGPYSTESNAVTPMDVPGAPQNAIAGSGNGQAEVSWNAPADNGGSAITDYVIQYSSDGGSTWDTFDDGVSTTTDTTVTGLTNGTEYVFRVAAVNTVGTGPYSTESNAVVPMTVPAAPGNLVPSPGDGQVVVTWDAPDDGGGAITDYVIQYSSDGGMTWITFDDGVSSGTEATVTGLTNNTGYVFRVAAVNTVGTGPYSSQSQAATPVVAPFDDQATSIYSADIQWLHEQGITVGCNPPLNSNYCPEIPLTRAEMATFLDRWLGFAPTSVDFFSDDDGSVYEPALNRAKAADVFRGCNPPDNNLVCPDDVITRGEVAAVLVRALGLTTDDPAQFTDAAGSLFARDIGILGAYGITRGCNPPGNDLYCPNDPVTRGQMAAMLHRASALP